MANKKPLFHEVSHKSAILPDYVADSILDIPISVLLERNIKHMILDVDGTLVPQGGEQLEPALIRYLKRVRQAGIELSIGSNRRRNITGIANSISAEVITRRWWSYKPLKVFYTAILAKSRAAPQSTVMIGDHILNDIIGANRLGIVTILVSPIGRQPGRLLQAYRSFLANH
jgi:HAD superfamily phosphatase (TIGR01668 family)